MSEVSVRGYRIAAAIVVALVVGSVDCSARLLQRNADRRSRDGVAILRG